MQNKDKLYLVGFLGLLAKSVVYEPFEKAVVTWTPPSWLLETASILTLVATLIAAVLLFIPKSK